MAPFISKVRVWNSDWPLYGANSVRDTESQDKLDKVPAFSELTVESRDRNSPTGHVSSSLAAEMQAEEETDRLGPRKKGQPNLGRSGRALQGVHKHSY